LHHTNQNRAVICLRLAENVLCACIFIYNMLQCYYDNIPKHVGFLQRPRNCPCYYYYRSLPSDSLVVKSTAITEATSSLELQCTLLNVVKSPEIKAKVINDLQEAIINYSSNITSSGTGHHSVMLMVVRVVIIIIVPAVMKCTSLEFLSITQIIITQSITHREKLITGATANQAHKY